MLCLTYVFNRFCVCRYSEELTLCSKTCKLYTTKLFNSGSHNSVLVCRPQHISLPRLMSTSILVQDKDMVSALLGMKGQLDIVLNQAFQKNELFSNALKEAFEKFINQRQNKYCLRQHSQRETCAACCRKLCPTIPVTQLSATPESPLSHPHSSFLHSSLRPPSPLVHAPSSLGHLAGCPQSPLQPHL